MKILLLICFLPLYSLAQYTPDEKIPFHATVVSDTGTVQGYFISSTDSAILVSPTKRYSSNSVIHIPVNTIRELHVKDPTHRVAMVVAGAVLGFILAAGLIQNNDYDNNGKTSFLELIIAAIDGSTSKDRIRRTTSLIVGAAGGATGMVVGMVIRKKFALIFPLNNRNHFFYANRPALNNYIRF